MIRLLRWGRPAWQTAADLAEEERLLEALGVGFSCFDGPAPELDGFQVLAVDSSVAVDRGVLEGAADLRLLVTTTSGYDHVDLHAATERGIAVARCPLARRDAVVATSLGMGLALLRRLPRLHARSRSGAWARSELPGLAPSAVSGERVGIVGMGVIGRRAAAAWRALGARVVFTDPAVPGGIPLGDLLSSCRLVTLHCSLQRSSTRLIDRRALDAMPPGAVLVNTARGRCVELDAVLAARHLGGVGLDVFPEEPCPRLREIAAAGDVLLAPHAAGYHPGLGRAVARELAAAVSDWLEGRPPAGVLSWRGLRRQRPGCGETPASTGA